MLRWSVTGSGGDDRTVRVFGGRLGEGIKEEEDRADVLDDEVNDSGVESRYNNV